MAVRMARGKESVDRKEGNGYVPGMAEPARRNISIRPSTEDLMRLDALCAAMADLGAATKTATVACNAFVAGLEVLEKRYRKARGKRGRS